MQDNELREILRETHPVRPGQEARAWTLLQAKLQGKSPRAWDWFLTPSWSLTTALVATVAVLFSAGSFVYLNSEHITLASADSQVPGIFATAFYSHSAKAQVVWLDGMEPLTGRPTYLDPTTPETPEARAKPPADPYSL